MFKKAILLQLMIGMLVITLAACATTEDQVTETPATIEASIEAAPTTTLPSEAPSTETSTVVGSASASPLMQGEEIALDHRGHQYNAVFKIQRYTPDYAGLVGQYLTPGSPIEGYPSQGDWIEIYNTDTATVDLAACT